MRMHHVFPLAGITLLLALGAPIARAADALAEARELLAAGQTDDAAVKLGVAAAQAQDDADLESERLVAVALDETLRSAGPPKKKFRRASEGPPALTDAQQDALALVLTRLDATRLGAFVSAPGIARELLYAATETGELGHVGTAARALETAAKQRAGGKSTKVLLDYARGLLARRDSGADAARPAFRAAYEAARAEGWVNLAAHAGTEIAWLLQDAGDAAGAEQMLHTIAEMFVGDVSVADGSAWVRCVQARLPAGADHLAKIVNDATGRLDPSQTEPERSVSSSGKAKSTPLGKAWKKMSTKRPLVGVRRTKDGARVKVLFKPKTDEVVLSRSCVQRVDRGGLRLVIRGHRVGLADFRLENYENYGGAPRGDQPTGRPRGSLLLVPAEYLLALGETWQVTKGGVVTIR